MTDDEFETFDWTRWHYEGKHFEAKAVSRGEFEALKRFGDYEEFRDGTLMRMEGEKEFRRDDERQFFECKIVPRSAAHDNKFS
jgi:hypothetical protein